MINFIGFSALFVLVMVFILIIFALWLWAIVDCVKSERPVIEKLLWILIILAFHFIGAILYFLLRNEVTSKKNTKKLTKSKDRIIDGVCGGIADYFDIDRTIVRLLWVLLTIFSFGTGVVLYLVAALIIPGKEKKTSVAWIAVGLICVIVFFILFIMLAGFFHYGGATVSQHIEHEINPYEKTRTVQSDIAEDMVIDYIYSHPSLENGYDLSCHSKMAMCPDSRKSCVLVRCNYQKNGTPVLFEAFVSDDKIIRTSFNEVKIRTASQCEEEGFEVLYPEIKGGPLQCETSNGIINVTSGCIDRCGDGICQHYVCMGGECPCPETDDCSDCA